MAKPWMLGTTRSCTREMKGIGEYSGSRTAFSPETSRPKSLPCGGTAAPLLRCMSRKTTGTCPCFSVLMCARFCCTMEKPSLKYQEIARTFLSTTLSRRSAVAEPRPRCARRSWKSSRATPRLLWPGRTTTWLIFTCGPSSWPIGAVPTLLANVSLCQSDSPAGRQRTSMQPGPAMRKRTAPVRLPSALEAIFASSHFPAEARVPDPELVPGKKTPSTRSWPSWPWTIWWVKEGSLLERQLPTNCAPSAPSVQEM
mmetsp:Transcript_7065/g.21460  ORF Transcript_7065/g.21460 Transcript_7065/m.21460 type:complete len:255 (-) Transcript_7065:805-1569(-)